MPEGTFATTPKKNAEWAVDAEMNWYERTPGKAIQLRIPPPASRDTVELSGTSDDTPGAWS